MRRIKVDIPFLVSVCILVIAGYIIFTSASFGLLSNQTVKYNNVAFNQTVFGLLLGTIACLVVTQINYKVLRKYSLFIFAFSAIATLLVFVPGLGLKHGGANRWIDLGFLTIQPSEFLKIGFIIFLSAWMARFKEKTSSFVYGYLPFLIILGVSSGILLLQPDMDTFFVLAISGFAIFLSAGGKWRYIFLSIFIVLAILAIAAYTKPYIMTRINTFINPSSNALGSGYQIQQSLISIGSGGVFGRGFGQSIQKFNVLPEPIGDSIFAVACEEFGFIGGVTLIILFIIFAFRGLKIATRSPDVFGGLVVVGIVIMIVAQAFVNIAAMVGVFPLSGITLPFVSHGGTALFMTLLEAGIVLNISRYQKPR